MSTARLTVALLAVLTLAVEKPGRIAITPASPDGAVLVLTPILHTPYSIGVSRYGVAALDIAAGSFDGNKDIAVATGNEPVARGPDSLHYFLRRVPAGTYVIREVSRRVFWAACFADATQSFTVGAGEIVFLGRFDAVRAIGDLDAAVERNRDSIARSSRHYFDGIAPPRLTGGDDPEAQRLATEWLRINSPGSRAPLRAATLKPARFGVGAGLFGGAHVCGGWNRKIKQPTVP